MPRLLSVSMLHRHGSRGPGASELTPWPGEATVNSQWLEHERENLSSVGHKQCEVLGQYYVDRYVISGAIDTDASRIFWRCSKSDRAKESGDDFILGFNRAMGRQVVGPDPRYYSVDADNYFRPWKIFKREANIIKDRQNTADVWKAKTAENADFLVEVFRSVGACDSLTAKAQKALWATTYLHAVKECEEYWPHDEGERRELSRIYKREYEERVTSLALWVWEQRFLHSGYTVHMGGRMAVDIIEHALSLEQTVSIYSGHDYTLLGTLCALNILQEFNIAMNFSAYILFELWDCPPDGTALDNYSGPVLRVIVNPTPFKNPDGLATLDVQTWQESVLKDFRLSEAVLLLSSLREGTKDLPMKPLGKHKEVETGIDMLS